MVKSIKGTHASVCRNGHFITRNMSHFKKIPDVKVNNNPYHYTLNMDLDNIEDCLEEIERPSEVQDQQQQQQHRYP